MAQQKVQVGLLVPVALANPLPTPEAYRRFFHEAESLGFHSLWVIDRLFHPINILDSLTVLTWAAAATQRVRLGTAVLLFALRSPVLVAKAVATLDYLSGGRVTLGVSLGGGEGEWQGVGLSIKERVARLRENITVMRRLWQEDRVTFQGRFSHAREATVNPKPVQPGGVPIILGTGAEAGLRRAVELADGWVAGGSSSVADVQAACQRLQTFAKEQGRDFTRFQIGKLCYTAVGRDRQQAGERLRPYLQGYYLRGFDMERNAAFGAPEECVAYLKPFVKAGVQTLILGPPSLDVDHLRRLAQEVVPGLS